MLSGSMLPASPSANVSNLNRHRPPGRKRVRPHRRRVRFRADDERALRSSPHDKRRTRYEAAAADGNDEHVQVRPFGEHLERHCARAGNHVGIAVGRHERRAGPPLRLRPHLGLVVGRGFNDVGAEILERAPLGLGRRFGRCTRTRMPNRPAAVASARPWLPADAVITELIEGCAALSRAIALAAPRILNAPVSCSVSSFSQTSPPVIVDSQADRTSGVVRATAAIRPAAATTSSNVGGTARRGQPAL